MSKSPSRAHVNERGWLSSTNCMGARSRRLRRNDTRLQRQSSSLPHAGSASYPCDNCQTGSSAPRSGCRGELDLMPAAPSDGGSYFGKYFLMKKLAAGGMGEIYLAKQQGPAGFQKILVVKKILSHLTENKEFIEAFLGEARLAAQMNHRNVVQVFDLGEETGSYFIAMEYVAGKTLREVIDAAT